MVFGGSFGPGESDGGLSSTEIFNYSYNVWRTIEGKMPFETTALRAVSYNNSNDGENISGSVLIVLTGHPR